jgi:putative ABC transport system permease protein
LRLNCYLRYVSNIILRNMQFRARQLLITIVGTALVFAMALLVTGLKQAFKTEADRAVDSIGGDAWVMRAGTEGPSTGLNFMPAGSWDQIAAVPGVRKADPVLLLPKTIRKGSDTKQLEVVGHRRHGLGEPPPEEGRRSRARGEVVVDKKLGFGLGDTFTVGGRKFTAVGLVSDHTVSGGHPLVYVPIEDVWALLHAGTVATAVVITGTPRSLPHGYKALSRQQVRDDALRPLRSAESAINNTRLLLWLVAAVIVGVVMYMSALERVRDFAVLKAVGATTRTLVLSLAAEAVLTCLIAAALAIGVAQLLLPIFPLPITYTLGAYAALPVIAVVVGVLASLAGVRRAVRVDPATAFAGT